MDFYNMRKQIQENPYACIGDAIVSRRNVKKFDIRCNICQTFFWEK